VRPSEKGNVDLWVGEVEWAKQNATGLHAALAVEWILPTVGNVTEIRSKFMSFAAGVAEYIYFDCVECNFEKLTQLGKLPIAVQTFSVGS
jgi:hypothetical protein